MSNDRELLEVAAKAYGVCLEWDGPPDQWQPMYYQKKTYYSFDPLTDRAEANALQEKLRINVVWDGEEWLAYVQGKHASGRSFDMNRAITLCAAAMGRNMK